jgi:hypothetical protein
VKKGEFLGFSGNFEEGVISFRETLYEVLSGCQSMNW